MYFILTKLSFDKSVSLFLLLLDILTGLEGMLKYTYILIDLYILYTLLKRNKYRDIHI